MGTRYTSKLRFIIWLSVFSSCRPNGRRFFTKVKVKPGDSLVSASAGCLQRQDKTVDSRLLTIIY